MLFGLHWIWAVALLVLVVIIFGVGRLPSVGGALGRGIRDFRRIVSSDDAKSSPDAETTEKD